MAANPLHAMTAWITELVVDHPHDLVDAVARRQAVGRRAAANAVRALVGAGWLQADGSGRHTTHRPGPLRQVVRSYPLAGLDEDRPWAEDFARCFTLPPAVQRMVQHAFCELVNNAIDHSGGDSVTVSLRQTPTQVQLLVSDNGLGLFDRVRSSHDIGSADAAMFELSKGELTSLPQRHRGRGLYFVARLADVFDLRANGAAFQRRQWSDGWHRVTPLARPGTSVYLAIALDTARTLDEVLVGASLDRRPARVDVTRVPLALLVNAQVSLDSRSQARRVARRLTQFREAELDFQGVSDIGHGFADELFRVWAGEHPGLTLRPVGMAPAVAAMVGAVQAEPPAVLHA